MIQFVDKNVEKDELLIKAMPRIIIQIFAPAIFPFTLKELYDNRDGDDY